jgi:hypothetical protein
MAQERQEPMDAGHAGKRLGRDLGGIQPYDEGVGAERVAHEPGGHAQRGVRATREAERHRAGDRDDHWD